MKIHIRQNEVFSYVKVKTITIDLKDFLPAFLKDLRKHFTYNDEELDEITSVAMLKKWMELKSREKAREDFKKLLGLTEEEMEDIDRESYIKDSLDLRKRSSRSYDKEPRFLIEGICSGFDSGINLISWLNLKRKEIIVKNSTLDEFLYNTEVEMKSKDLCDKSWLEMVDEEGQLLEKSEDYEYL
jgi:hypothetical protein